MTSSNGVKYAMGVWDTAGSERYVKKYLLLF